MADIKKAFGVDKAKSEDGTWVDLEEGIRVKIARIGNLKYRKELEKLSRPRRRQIRRGTLSEEVAEQMLTEVMANTVLLDWEGIEENGKRLSYNPANAKRLLTEYPDFREMISDLAGEMETFKQEFDEESEKNSRKSSGST